MIQSIHFSRDQSMKMIMILNFLSNFKFYFDCNEGLFYKSKINSQGIYVIRTKTWSEGFSKSKERRCTNVTSHVNSIKSNYLNTYNSDITIVNSNIPCIKIYTKRSSNELSALKKETDTESITSINE